MTANQVDFEIGDRVHHFKFGAGVVVAFSQMEDGGKTIEVDFETSGINLLLLAHVKLQKVNDDALQAKKIKHHNWPASTFVHEPADQPHYMGSHWEAFCEDQAILKNLPEYLIEQNVQQGYGSFYPSPLALLDNAPKAFQHNYINHNMGLSSVMESTSEGNFIRTIFPFCSKGAQTSLRLERVHVWDDRLEAQIEANWQGLEIFFFDTRFIHDRAWYVTQHEYEFILTGIAYSAKLAERHVIKIKHSPEVIQRMIEMGVIEHADDFSGELDTSQAAVLLPIAEWDRDDYQFQGKIKELVTFDDFLGQSGWLATVVVMRTLADDLDQDLKIVITQRAWQAETPPEVETYIQGALWLQGYLWNVTNKHQF
ncbi:MAG: hypothetical protein ABL920_02975 [Methylotenera sp.]